jgi:hypothetical protein
VKVVGYFQVVLSLVHWPVQANDGLQQGKAMAGLHQGNYSTRNDIRGRPECMYYFASLTGVMFVFN